MIISLCGRSNCGKTTTLNLLIDMLREYGEEINPTVPQERRKLFIYKSLTIGISLDGDTEDVLLNNVYFFEENSCDIAISATRIRIYAPVSMYAEKKGLTVDWVYMPYVEFLPEEKREYVDKAVAEYLFGKI